MSVADIDFYRLALYALWFFLYSFLGWAFEVFYTYAVEKSWVNRGFVNGPVCPIYGAGALLAIIVLRPLGGPLVQFTVGVLGATAMEYVTSWALERIFHARWWDYSNLPFNLNGRVSLFSSLLFGVMMLAVNFVAQPFLEGLIATVPSAIVRIVALILTLAFAMDLAASVVHMNGLNAQMDVIQRYLQVVGSAARERVNGAYQQARLAVDQVRGQVGETAANAADLARETVSNMRDLRETAGEGLRAMRGDRQRSEILAFLAELLPSRPSFFERKSIRDPQFRMTTAAEAFEWLKEHFREARPRR